MDDIRDAMEQALRTLEDDSRPRRIRHNRTTGKRGRTKPPKEHLFSNIEVRFVYENELVGEWFSLKEVMERDVPVLPNPEFRVIRIQFKDVSEI